MPSGYLTPINLSRNLTAGDGIAFRWHQLKMREVEIVSNARKEHIMIQYYFPIIFLGGMLVIAGIVTRVSKT
jgi:hypothetical protein